MALEEKIIPGMFLCAFSELLQDTGFTGIYTGIEEILRNTLKTRALRFETTLCYLFIMWLGMSFISGMSVLVFSFLLLF